MEEGKSVLKEYQEIEAKIDKIKKEIENIRKLKILDDKKEKEEELTKKENVFMTEFTSLRPIRKTKMDQLKALRNEIKTMQTIDSNFQVTKIKNFEFWSETMIKKLDFESKYGTINLQTNTASQNVLANKSISMTSNNLNNLSSISHASELNERLMKKVDQFKAKMNL